MVYEKKLLSEKLLISKLMHNNKNREPWKRQFPRTDSALVAFFPIFSLISSFFIFSVSSPFFFFSFSSDLLSIKWRSSLCSSQSSYRMWGKNVGEI